MHLVFVNVVHDSDATAARTGHYGEHSFGHERFVQVMELAFSSSWRELLVTGILATVNAEAVREALALRIVRTARRGEHDLNRLCQDAVDYALRAYGRSALAHRSVGPNRRYRRGPADDDGAGLAPCARSLPPYAKVSRPANETEKPDPLPWSKRA